MGGAVVGFIELLQIPLESVFAVILSVIGIAGDAILDGAEASLARLEKRCAQENARPKGKPHRNPFTATTATGVDSAD
jgi:hypothetical protein